MSQRMFLSFYFLNILGDLIYKQKTKVIKKDEVERVLHLLLHLCVYTYGVKLSALKTQRDFRLQSLKFTKKVFHKSQICIFFRGTVFSHKRINRIKTKTIVILYNIPTVY